MQEKQITENSCVLVQEADGGKHAVPPLSDSPRTAVAYDCITLNIADKSDSTGCLIHTTPLEAVLL